MNSWCQILLVVHSLLPLVEVDSLVSVDVESANHRNYLRLRCTITVHAAEVHDVVVVQASFATVVNSLEGAHIRPVQTALKATSDCFHLNVVLNLALEEKSDLLFNCETESRVSGAVMTWALSDH